MKVSEVFFSIQGEGVFIGLPTVFVRLFGCNLDCSWCDTGYARGSGVTPSEEPEGDWQELDIEEIVQAVLSYSGKRVCLTGGEPLYHGHSDIYRLVRRFRQEGCEISIETNGSFILEKLIRLPVTIVMDVKTPSSGMAGRMNFRNMTLLRTRDVLKFVIADEEDFEFAHAVLRKTPSHASVVFTPEGGTNITWLVETVLKTGLDVRVLPQLHKLVFPGKERGV